MNKKQREEPFHVRRVRMKQSIIKSNQMLENLTLSDNNLRKFRAVTEPTCQEQEGPEIKRKHTFNSSMINELDLLNLNINKLNFNRIKYAVQLSKSNQYKKASLQMHQNGLEAIHIQAKPSSKKIFHSKEYQEKCFCKISGEDDKKGRVHRTKTLRYASPQEEISINKSVERYRNKLPLIEMQDETARIFIDAESSRSIKKIQKIDFEPLRKGKVKQYLYEKMALTTELERDRSNLVYEKRIKSFTEFIWKLLIAHNVYLNLDLSPRWNQQRLKAYIGQGNNCNMIKGLMKRRFWWSISDTLTEDCTFIWTQIKIDKIYQRQEITYENPTKLVRQLNEQDLEQLLTKSKKKLPQYLTKSLKKQDRQKFSKEYSFNKKLWSSDDCQLLERYFLFQRQRSNKEQIQEDDNKSINYRDSTEKINQRYKKITFIDTIHTLRVNNDQKVHNYYQTKPILHNHIQNNFLLGNKKALFYNLKEYYQKIGEDLFSYIPLTFHVKTGFKDPEYKNFISYFRNQAKTLGKDLLERQKNIWIVKPGENSNRGNGIIVIDQIYEFDNLIKKSEKRTKKESNVTLPQTYIIQKYIDRPFLYYQRKFDIRHYLLMTTLYGVTRAYWYEQGYIRTSSYPFDIDNFEAHIHLTNDAVQKNYSDYGKFQSHNKISYNEFQCYLNMLPDKKYNFKEQILPQMKKMATDAAKSVYLKVSSKQQMHNFEVFGLDFMIDRKFKPWLIEINTNPCLQCQCPLLNRIIPYMVEQSLKLSVDLIYPPPSHYPSLWKHNAPLIDLQTFKYELIFDSLSEGESLRKLYSHHPTKQFSISDIGLIQVDECFRDDGKQIKLQDFT